MKQKEYNTCDDCKHYHWYYDYCDKWGYTVDSKSKYACIEPLLEGSLFSKLFKSHNITIMKGDNDHGSTNQVS